MSGLSQSVLTGRETAVAFSELGKDIPKEKLGGVFVGLQGKPGVNVWNLAAIPLLVFLTLSSDSDAIQEVPYLLNDPLSFNLTVAEASRLNTKAAEVANWTCMACLLAVGIIYDMFGRRPTVCGLLVLGGVATMGMPFSEHSEGLFIALRTFLQVSLICLMANTLINDYVILEHRGKATAFMESGVTLGNIFSIGVIFTITDNWVNQNKIKMTFLVLGGMQILWSIIMFFMVDEPIVLDAKEEKRAARKSFCGKIWSLMKQVYKALRADRALFIGILLCSIMKNVVMLQQITYPQWCRAYIGIVF